ncbi:hypothetical protein GWR56_07835 [Mucilaginibacter sp. 14171R-50]|uniref:hypothetical protein n=1 Tax=Mucilaginibacter sp. 14171R-50 TaxID=2703789 RepID=UPI00138C118A|nr:hypothetical protein [Mucilaginibacter sp. 14171R-50]QHS55455.1 hypothetical protein GWR56_07835 [Mucilaginibacter sp. 14171R-50]
MKTHTKSNDQEISRRIIIGLSSIAVLLTVTLLILSVGGCKKPNEDIKLNVNESSLTKAPVLVHFANANVNSMNQPLDFDVEITGKDAALVQMDGGATSGFKASHGFLPLSLLREASPSATSPVTFNVSAQIPGFAPLVQTITITKDTATIVDIGAIEYAHPPKGTAVLTAVSPLSNGVSNGATLNLQAGAGMVETAQINIQPGTQMLDQNNMTINAGQLSSNIVNYSATSTTSYGAFPGGFSPTNVVDATGKQVNGGYPINFVSAGLLSIKMTAGGTQVRHFSKPLKVTMKLDPHTTNFVTGKDIKAGDTVPLWSLTEETGQWKSEGDVTITADGSGNLVAIFETSHLCCFNLDWSWAITGRPYGTCFSPLTVRIHCGAGNSGIYDVTICTPNNQYLAGAHGEYVHDGDVVVFPSVPNIEQCKVVISGFNLYLNPGLPILAQSQLFNPCSQGAIDLTFGTPPANPTFVNVNFNIQGHCSNKAINLLPSGWFFLYDAGAAKINQNPWTYIYVSKGVIKYAFGTGITGGGGSYHIQLFAGDQYYMYTYNSFEWYESALFTMAARNFDFPSHNGITGTAIYDVPSNSLNINVKFSVHCR